MNKAFDHDRGGRMQWIAWLSAIMKEVYRVLKPGAYGLVWSLPRTSYWTGTALDDAGFTIRDCVYHLFGGGFPKSLDISKQLDRMAGVKRETWEIYRNGGGGGRSDHIQQISPNRTSGKGMGSNPATLEARQWNGWGTALKPAVECWWLVQKPISEQTIAKNVLRWGVGGLNIDKSRISTEDSLKKGGKRTAGRSFGKGGELGDKGMFDPGRGSTFSQNTLGRWPANLLLSHSLFCSDTTCDESCPVKMLDEQTGILKSGSGVKAKKDHSIGFPSGEEGYKFKEDGQYCEGNSGGASRYFKTFYYAAKASRRDRSSGGTINNTHPTCKNTQLMCYLINLVCPERGYLLDCFAGSGSTLVAAIECGRQFIGIEQEQEYCDIARARVANTLSRQKEV